MKCGCSSQTITQPTCSVCNPLLPSLPSKCLPIEEVNPFIDVQNLELGIETAHSFNLPKCGQQVIIKFKDVSNVVIGSNIWNSTYGNLYVVAVSGFFVTVINACSQENKVGSLIPEGTIFVVGAPFIKSQTLLPVFLASTFVVPAIGSCTTVRFTSLLGVTLGATVSLNNKTYWLSQITDEGAVVLCNNGGGGIPGSVLTPVNDQNLYLYQIKNVSNSFAAVKNVTLAYDSLAELASSLQIVMPIANPRGDSGIGLIYTIKASYDFETIIVNSTDVINYQAKVDSLRDSNLLGSYDFGFQIYNGNSSPAKDSDTMSVSGILSVPPLTLFNLIGVYTIGRILTTLTNQTSGLLTLSCSIVGTGLQGE